VHLKGGKSDANSGREGSSEGQKQGEGGEGGLLYRHVDESTGEKSNVVADVRGIENSGTKGSRMRDRQAGLGDIRRLSIVCRDKGGKIGFRRVYIAMLREDYKRKKEGPKVTRRKSQAPY